PGTDPSRWPERIRVRKYFEYDYAGFIRDAAPDVQALTTIGTRGFFFGDSNLITSGHYSVEKVIVRGAEPQYIDAIPLFSIARGRFISAFDQEHTRPVVVLGAAISESLFPNTDALGKTVRINGSVYEVVGVFEHDQGLFVGPGVDIFAVISVTERTQEIGVRKAIGARRADVRLQFLLEAVVLTLVGGTIGILIGAGVSATVRTLVPSIPATLSYLWVTIGFAISVGVGLFF